MNVIQINWSDEPGVWQDYCAVDPKEGEDEQIVRLEREANHDLRMRGETCQANFRLSDISTKR